MNKVPCKDCVDRHTLCHSSCQRYIEYKVCLNNIKDAKFKAYKSNDDYLRCIYTMRRKSKGMYK